MNDYKNVIKTRIVEACKKDLALTFNFAYKSGLPSFLRRLFNNPSQQENDLKDFVYIEILLPNTQNAVLEMIYSKLSSYSTNNHYKKFEKENLSWNDIQSYMQDILKFSKYKIILLSVINSEYLWNDGYNICKNLLLLNSVLREKVQFVFSIPVEIENNQKTRALLGDMYPFIFTNFLYVGLMDDSLIEENLENIFNNEISMITDLEKESVIKIIVKLSGGHIGLAMSLLRLLNINGSLPGKYDECISEPEISYILNKIWDSFLPQTQENVLSNNKLNDLNNEFITRTEIVKIDSKTENLIWFSPLFEAFINYLKKKEKNH